MSDPASHPTGMKIKFFSRRAEKAKVVVIFGRAQLIKHRDGRMELRGGSRGERLEAREWISIFMHEAVVNN